MMTNWYKEEIVVLTFGESAQMDWYEHMTDAPPTHHSLTIQQKLSASVNTMWSE